jgi:uncharacterized membrane protein
VVAAGEVAAEAVALVEAVEALVVEVQVAVGKSVVPEKLTPFFSAADLDAITAAIQEEEKHSAGEIRVHISHRLPFFKSARRDAIRIFKLLEMHKTKDATGVLLFVTLREQRFEIVADHGIDTRAQPGIWKNIAAEISSNISDQGLTAGICHGVHRIGEVLAQHAPRKPDDQDELSNEISFDE